MLVFFITISLVYLTVWAFVGRRLAKHIKSFDPKRGTPKGGKVYYHPQSHEGRVLVGFVYGTMLMVGARVTLVFCFLIGIFYWL